MKSVVYFIEAQFGIKTGHPIDLKTRITALRSECGTSLESKLHKLFASHRVYKKEWFAEHPTIYRYIQKYTSSDFRLASSNRQIALVKNNSKTLSPLLML